MMDPGERLREVLQRISWVRDRRFRGPRFSYQAFCEEFSPTRFDDYAKMFDELYNGGDYSRFVSDPVIYFASTSATTADPKMIPHTKRSLQAYLKGAMPIFARLARRWPGSVLQPGRLMLIAGRGVTGYSPCGTPVGAISGRIAWAIHSIAPWLLAVDPKWIDSEESSRYDRVVQAFASKTIRGVLGTNPRLILEILKDTSVVGGGAGQRLDFVVTLTGQPERWHAERLKGVLGSRTEVLDPGVGSSEGLFTNGALAFDPVGTAVSSKYQFIEWQVEGRDEAHWDLRAFPGAVVEPLLTSVNGFVRYRIGDFFRVDSNGKTVEFLGRREKVVSIVGERVAEQHVIEVVKAFASLTGRDVADFLCIGSSVGEGRGRYWFIIDDGQDDVPRPAEGDERLLDELFAGCNIEVAYARQERGLLLPSRLVSGSSAASVLRHFREDKKAFHLQAKDVILVRNAGESAPFLEA